MWQGWKMQEWTMRHHVAIKGGQCGSGQCRSGELRVKMCNIVMTGKESMTY